MVETRGTALPVQTTVPHKESEFLRLEVNSRSQFPLSKCYICLLPMSEIVATGRDGVNSEFNTLLNFKQQSGLWLAVLYENGSL